VLLITKNYTGDKLNFGLAAEQAKAEGRDVRIVFVEDDVSIKGNALVGRRGLAGTVFVHKVAGAAAAQGYELMILLKKRWPLICLSLSMSLDEVTRVAQRTADSLATVAVSLDRCSVPQREREDQQGLDPDTVEYGMGMFSVVDILVSYNPQVLMHCARIQGSITNQERNVENSPRWMRQSRNCSACCYQNTTTLPLSVLARWPSWSTTSAG
jgi:dihydroxyacetone kinase